MSIPIDLKRKREEAFFESDKMRKIEQKIDLNPLFFTIYEEVQGGQEDSNAKKIADLLSLNPEIFYPFHHVPLKRINSELNFFAIGLDVDQPTKKKLKNITKQLYRYTLKNSSINQLLSSRNAELDTFQKLLDRNLQTEVHAVQRRARALFRELRLNGIEGLDVGQIQAYSSQLHQLAAAFAPILELKKCDDADENTRLKHLAMALKQENAEVQFPGILSDYPQIVGKVQELEPLFKSISATIKTICSFQAALQSRQGELAGPPLLSFVEQEVLIPFGDLFYSVAADYFWRALQETAGQKKDADFEFLIASGSLTSPVPDEIDYVYLNQVWGLYFTGPGLEHGNFDEWLHQVLLRVDPEHLRAVCEVLQDLTRIVNRIVEDLELPKLEKEVVATPYRQEMRERASELLAERFFAQHRTLADIKTFLLDCLK